jgi:hypothetical protein
MDDRFVGKALAASLVTLSISACASVSVGPMVVGSSGLGYRSPYYGARVVVAQESERVDGRLELQATNAEKIGGGTGGGASARAVVDLRFGHWFAGAGLRAAVQRSSVWGAQSVWSPTVEVGRRFAPLTLHLYADAPDSSRYRTYAVGLRIETHSQPAIVIEAERVGFRGSPTVNPRRATLALLWKLRE